MACADGYYDRYGEWDYIKDNEDHYIYAGEEEGVPYD